MSHELLVTSKQIAGVNLAFDIIEGGIVAIGDDCLGEALELGEVVDYAASKESGAIGEGRLVDD